MADWHGVLPLTQKRLQDLETFIREPDTRQHDIFDHGTLIIGSPLSLDWIIKHDLYEGVVMHFSLMDTASARFLAGNEAALSQAQDVLATFAIHYQGNAYILTVQNTA